MKRSNPNRETAESKVDTRSVQSSDYLPGLFFLSAFPREEIWRLFVDGCLWSKENGWQGYESREPGSLSAALESLCSIALELNEGNKEFELSVELIKKIHKKCGRKVKELEDKKPGETRTEAVSFGISASHASIKGIEEFLSIDFLVEGKAGFGPGKINVIGAIIEFNYFENLTKEKITPELLEKIYSEMQKKGHSYVDYFYRPVRENVEVYLEAITSSYNKEIKEAKTLDEKLYVIVKHIRQYEVLHPFRDANGRTFVNNLLNILLMQHGLPPATFYEPNVFDLYSADELVVVIKEAIFNTLNIIENSNNNKSIFLYGYRASLEDKDKFKDILDSSSYDDLKKIDFSSFDIKKIQDNTRKCLSSLDKKIHCIGLHFMFGIQKK